MVKPAHLATAKLARTAQSGRWRLSAPMQRGGGGGSRRGMMRAWLLCSRTLPETAHMMEMWVARQNSLQVCAFCTCLQPHILLP